MQARKDQIRFEAWKRNVDQEEFSYFSANSTDWHSQDDILDKVTSEEELDKTMRSGLFGGFALGTLTMKAIAATAGIAAITVTGLVFVGLAVTAAAAAVIMGGVIGGRYLSERHDEFIERRKKIKNSLTKNYADEGKREAKINKIKNRYQIQPSSSHTITNQLNQKKPRKIADSHKTQMQALIETDSFSALAINRLMNKIHKYNLSKEVVIKLIENYDKETQIFLFKQCLDRNTELGKFFSPKNQDHWFVRFFRDEDKETLDTIQTKLSQLQQTPDPSLNSWWEARAQLSMMR